MARSAQINGIRKAIAVQDKPSLKQAGARKNVETIAFVSAWMKWAILSDFVRFSRAILLPTRHRPRNYKRGTRLSRAPERSGP